MITCITIYIFLADKFFWQKITKNAQVGPLIFGWDLMKFYPTRISDL